MSINDKYLTPTAADIYDNSGKPTPSRIIQIRPTIKWSAWAFLAVIAIVATLLSTQKLLTPFYEDILPKPSRTNTYELHVVCFQTAIGFVFLFLYWLYRIHLKKLMAAQPPASHAALEKATRTYGWLTGRSLSRLLGHWCGYGKTYQAGNGEILLRQPDESISRQSPYCGSINWGLSIFGAYVMVFWSITCIASLISDVHTLKNDWPILASKLILLLGMWIAGLGLFIQNIYEIFPGGVTVYRTAPFFGKWKPKTFLQKESVLVYRGYISVASPGQSSTFRIRPQDVPLFMGTWLKPCEEDVKTALSDI